ncbi:beta-ketoacyl synthase chain length factor [Pseudoalteromonas luteoviolacea]|uniref:beta-ketoacyl synthase chain length factor n=1 Tax=Pseudoalteromonas luteoviolacea TaxID=43657 RepID=UPI001153558E|nr:beta-ketoacyl synthase chain length factor [Pseudoalteromonas luteoviolacea]TQF69588.1 beta-ketoacyl synthase chain length factor [Pseudoalteromonas luteoviolacea]
MQFELAIDDYFILTPTQIGNIDLKQLLSDLKPMQKRRLSYFAKLAMGSLLQLDKSDSERLNSQMGSNCELVFASRHGDFHKTSELLDTLAAKQELSPTAFSLSVHNAVSGLYSIFKNKKIPITAISAGKDTFLSALIESYIRIHSKRLDKVILIYVDQALPDHYQCFSDEELPAHTVALELSACTESNDDSLKLAFRNETDVATNGKSNACHSLCFAEWITSVEPQLILTSERTSWVVKKL